MKPLRETRTTEGIGRLSGDGESGFLEVKSGKQTTFNHDWKKKKLIRQLADVVDFENLFPPVCDELCNHPEKTFKFKVTIEVEAEKPNSWYETG